MSQVARVEVPAALWRKHRMGKLDVDSTAVLIMAFEADYFGTEDEPPRFAAVRLAATVLDDAARMSGVHGLRTAAATEGFALVPG